MDADASTTQGRAAIAQLVASGLDVGFRVELLPPLLVHGNYAAGTFRWSNAADEGCVLAVFRIDRAGLIAHQEIIGR